MSRALQGEELCQVEVFDLRSDEVWFVGVGVGVTLDTELRGLTRTIVDRRRIPIDAPVVPERPNTPQPGADRLNPLGSRVVDAKTLPDL
jgi:hypothetical protein